MQQNKVLKRVLIILIPVLVISFGVTFYLWYHYANKNNLFEKYTVDNSKEVYILGTIDKKHFNRIYNYSMEDMLSVIYNVNPDVVMIDARADHYIKHGIVDGTIDMCVAYSYCYEHKIPMEMVDWWMVDNIYPRNATTNLRDDNIFIKVSRKVKNMPSGSKILVISGSDHFHEQVARFNVSGYKHTKIENKKDYFKPENEVFKFPPLASKVWKDRTYFYAYTFPNTIKETMEIHDNIKNKFINANHDKFYRRNIKYCKYLNNDILYK